MSGKPPTSKTTGCASTNSCRVAGPDPMNTVITMPVAQAYKKPIPTVFSQTLVPSVAHEKGFPINLSYTRGPVLGQTQRPRSPQPYGSGTPLPVHLGSNGRILAPLSVGQTILNPRGGILRVSSLPLTTSSSSTTIRDRGVANNMMRLTGTRTGQRRRRQQKRKTRKYKNRK